MRSVLLFLADRIPSTCAVLGYQAHAQCASGPAVRIPSTRAVCFCSSLIGYQVCRGVLSSLLASVLAVARAPRAQRLIDVGPACVPYLVQRARASDLPETGRPAGAAS